jgi:hypothetical protein
VVLHAKELNLILNGISLMGLDELLVEYFDSEPSSQSEEGKTEKERYCDC